MTRLGLCGIVLNAPERCSDERLIEALESAEGTQERQEQEG